MSGPKGIVIEDPAEVERRQNESQIALLCSEYASVFLALTTECQKLAKYSGKPSATSLPSIAQVRREVDRLLSADYVGNRAIQYLKKKSKELDKEIASRRGEGQAIANRAQIQFRELKSFNQDFALGRTRLLDFAKFSTGEEWPESVREKIAGLEAGLSSMECPSAPDNLVMEHRALDELSDAHGAAKGMMERFEQVRLELTELINNAYSEQVTSRLRDRLPRLQSIEEFLAEHKASKGKAVEKSKEDGTLEKLDRLLGMVLALDALPDHQSLQGRADEIRKEGDVSRRRMLYEDLVISCDRNLKHLKKVGAWQEEMGKLMELANSLHSKEGSDFRIELENLQRAGSPVALDTYHERAKGLFEKQQEAAYREERRVAVLGALESMGYEVMEGMQTGKVEGGRLVFQKDPDSEYALEVVSSDGKEIVQTRIIRFGDATNGSSELQKRKDMEVEEDWCEDHAGLLQKLRDEGYQVAFRLKRKPGEMDVKVVSPPKWWEERQKKLKDKRRSREAGAAKGQMRKP
jgi:hypothetical protein